jgi:hypothetical protein
MVGTIPHMFYTWVKLKYSTNLVTNSGIFPYVSLRFPKIFTQRDFGKFCFQVKKLMLSLVLPDLPTH